MTEVANSVEEFLAESGVHRESFMEGPLWRTSDEGLLVVERGGSLDVASWSRGQVSPPRLTGANWRIIEIYLVLNYGNSWRSRHGLGFLKTIERGTAPPDGFEVLVEDDGNEGLVVPADPSIHLGGMLPGGAARLAHALTIPLQDLINSFKHPDGRPAFPMGGRHG